MRDVLVILAGVVILAIYHPQFVLSLVLGLVFLFGLVMVVAALIKNGRE